MTFNLMPVIALVSFYIFAATVILVPVVGHYRHKAAMRRIVSDALANERRVDPELLAKLMPAPRPADGRLAAFWFCAPGILLVAVALGLGMAALLYPDPVERSRQVPAAIVFGCLGLGFLGAAAAAWVLLKSRPLE